MRIVTALIGTLVIVAVGFIGSIHAQSQPVIASVTTVAGGLIITGGGFGTHGDFGGPQQFLNAAWNDFGNGINGGNLALDGTNNAAWSYQMSGGRTPTKRWARKDWNPNTDDSIRRLGALSLNMTGTTGEFYSSFWLRCGPKVDQAAKFWRIYGLLPNPNDGSTQKNLFLSITDGFNLMAGGGSDGNPPPTTVWAVQTGPVQCANRWQHFEVYLRDHPDDFYSVTIDGALAFRRGSQLPSFHRDIEGSLSNERQQWVTAPWGGDGHTMDIGHMVDQDYWGFSDVYIDYTQARVVLTDNPTWSASRLSEVQIPTAWATDRITVQFNPGTFQVGRTVYAYVVRGDGFVNATGFPVILGTSQPPPNPAPALSISCPPSQVISLSSGVSTPVSFPAPTATGGTAPLTNPTTLPVSGSTFPIGATIVTGTVRDSASQVATCNFTVTVIAPPPATGGCVDPGPGSTTGARYQKGGGPGVEELPYTTGNAAQMVAVAARARALTAAGFIILPLGKDGSRAFWIPTCDR